MNKLTLIGLVFLALCSAACVKNGDVRPLDAHGLEVFRAQWIYKLEHPKKFVGCDDLPTIPWTRWTLKDGGPSANLPGYIMIDDSPAEWDDEELRTRPQIGDNDKPIGKLQQGDDLWFVYQLPKGDLVTCSQMPARDNIPDNVCDAKRRIPKRYCNYTQTILIGH